MDKIKVYQYARRRLATYKKYLTKPESIWPNDIQRGLIHLNKDLFEIGCTVMTIKEKNGTPHKNYSSRFRRYVRMTPRDYITFHRTAAAKFLMRDKNLKNISVNDIGWLVGYEKPQTFSMLYKKKMGLPPRKWREQYFHNEIIEE